MDLGHLLWFGIGGFLFYVLWRIGVVPNVPEGAPRRRQPSAPPATQYPSQPGGGGGGKKKNKGNNPYIASPRNNSGGGGGGGGGGNRLNASGQPKPIPRGFTP
jgi:hypothetical protein